MQNYGEPFSSAFDYGVGVIFKKAVSEDIILTMSLFRIQAFIVLNIHVE